MSTYTGTMRQFVERQLIRSSATLVDHNPNRTDDDWSRTANHWRVTLRRGSRQMTVYFSMGPALSGEPTTEEVLDSIAGDAAGVMSARSFEEWASEYGYDTDSRQAERTYLACKREAEKLARFIPEPTLSQLLWHTESL